MKNTVIGYQNAQKRIGNAAMILIRATCEFKLVARELTINDARKCMLTVLEL